MVAATEELVEMMIAIVVLMAMMLMATAAAAVAVVIAEAIAVAAAAKTMVDGYGNVIVDDIDNSDGNAEGSDGGNNISMGNGGSI